MQHLPAEHGEQRQHTFERGPVTGREDRDVPRPGAVTPARDGAVDGGHAHPATRSPSRTISGEWVVDISIHTWPGRSPAITPSSASSTAAEAAGDEQARDHHVDRLGHRHRGGAHFAPPSRNGWRRLGRQVAHGEVDAVAQQRPGELAADVAEPDEADADRGEIERGEVLVIGCSSEPLGTDGDDLRGSTPPGRTPRARRRGTTRVCGSGSRGRSCSGPSVAQKSSHKPGP